MTLRARPPTMAWRAAWVLSLGALAWMSRELDCALELKGRAITPARVAAKIAERVKRVRCMKVHLLWREEEVDAPIDHLHVTRAASSNQTERNLWVNDWPSPTRSRGVPC